MKDIYIFGSGNNAKLIALILGIKDLYVSKNEIDTQNKVLSNVITIPFSELSEDELKKLKDILDYDDCVVTKKIGFKYKNQLYDKANTLMILNYLKKQNRKYIDDFNFKTSYDTIDVAKYLQKVNHTFILKDENEVKDKQHCICIYTNKQFKTSGTFTYEYAITKNNEMHGYSYTYDCDLDSDVKRYSSNCTEYLKEVKGSLKIKNYSDKPMIYTTYDIIEDKKCYYVGRYATKTRMLLSHAIKFALKLKEENE